MSVLQDVSVAEVLERWSSLVADLRAGADANGP